MLIVTSSSENYFHYLQKFLHNLSVSEKDSKLIIYDLGLLVNQLEWLKNNNYEVRKFNFDLYPDFIRMNDNIEDSRNIKNRIKKGCSVFKSIIINDLLYEFKDSVLWIDCKNRYKNIADIKRLIEKNGFFFPIFEGRTILSNTHPWTLKYLNVEEDILTKPLLTNQIMGWEYSKKGILKLSDDFKKYCLVEHWIKPEGANDLNHGFEYSIFSILFYQYQKIYGFNLEYFPLFYPEP